jgi:uncharacterized protein YidB (DUF937 family)
MNWIKRIFGFFTFDFVPASSVAVIERNETEEFLHLLQDHIAAKGGIRDVARRFERAGFTGKVRSWRGQGARLPINSVEVLQLLGWAELRELSQKADIPVDRLRERLAELLPVAVTRAFAKIA